MEANFAKLQALLQRRDNNGVQRDREQHRQAAGAVEVESIAGV